MYLNEREEIQAHDEVQQVIIEPLHPIAPKIYKKNTTSGLHFPLLTYMYIILHVVFEGALESLYHWNNYQKTNKTKFYRVASTAMTKKVMIKCVNRIRL